MMPVLAALRPRSALHLIPEDTRSDAALRGLPRRDAPLGWRLAWFWLICACWRESALA